MSQLVSFETCPFYYLVSYCGPQLLLIVAWTSVHLSLPIEIVLNTCKVIHVCDLPLDENLLILSTYILTSILIYLSFSVLFHCLCYRTCKRVSAVKPLFLQDTSATKHAHFSSLVFLTDMY